MHFQIEIGGFHVKNSSKPLSNELLSFIESAENGVIYFSLGGNLRPSKMKKEKKNAIISVLKSLKQKVIWKWDDESLKLNSDQFLIGKWFPQDEILSHLNVKLFVTHGGLLSCTESIIRQTPIVGIPIFGDQMMNMMRAERNGWGITVEFKNLTEESLSWAINEVLSNPKYSKNVKEISNRLQDQPQTAMERAIFWIEFVLRHNGADFMKTSARHLNFVEYHNLDVYAIMMTIAIAVILSSICVVRFTMKLLCCTRQKSVKNKMN